MVNVTNGLRSVRTYSHAGDRPWEDKRKRVLSKSKREAAEEANPVGTVANLWNTRHCSYYVVASVWGTFLQQQ